jgi:flagellar motility protein MotE (MotC chaperone)
MIELEREGMRGDPEQETRVWLEKLSEVDRKRSRFQDQAAEGLMTLDELRAKLADLEETRATIERELKVLQGRQEHLESLERDKDALLKSYAKMAPEALDSLSGEERHQLYKMLRLKVAANFDGTLEVSGFFGSGVRSWETSSTPFLSTTSSSIAAISIPYGTL